MSEAPIPLDQPSDEDIKKIFETKIEYEDTVRFCHCSHCFDEYQKSGQDSRYAPCEFLEYEGGVVPFKYPDGKTASIFVLWCKRCKRKVWDSRHLQPWI